ncbi:uncharacterized protein LOC129887541 [Solanum dulcamara]|uniref:uncharacterized protein LOC129887541 n=1 Tax=Solanum dulcamara TaxID=45834 RepID=UPI002484ECA1|nr:uncharacterized protein LOC129887541 [Solanum dulcamara]
MMPQVPTINQVYAMVNQDESQRIVAGTSRMMHKPINPTAMYTSRNGSDSHKQKRAYDGHSFCDFCDMKGHTRGDCNKLKKCDLCHMTRFTRDDVFKPAYGIFSAATRINGIFTTTARLREISSVSVLSSTTMP